MLKFKLQHFSHLTWRGDSLEKTLMLGKIESRRRVGWQRTRWLDGITDSMDIVWASSGRWWRTGKTGGLQSMRSQGVRHDWATKQQQQCLSGLIRELEPSGLSGVRSGSKAVGTQMLEAGDGEEPSRLIIGQWKSVHTRHHISKMAFAQIQFYLSRRFHIYHFILCLCYLFILRIIEALSLEEKLRQT